MAKKLLASVMAFALCLFVSAADMVVKGKNGEDQKINVVDTSETFLRFKILSDSTVELTNESSCRGHESITIPEKVRIEGKVYTVTSIGYFAFKECSSLTSINIPEGVTSIGDNAFDGCDNLEPKLLIYDKGTKCYGWVGDKKKCTKVVIPKGVTSIGDWAFSGCSSLNSIKIPEGVTNIGEYAFLGCDNLEPKLLVYDKGTKCYGWIGNVEKCTNVVIPEGVTSIGEWAFYECRSLTSIKIPEGVTSIGEWAFKGCSSLNSIKIPEGVTCIGERAFKGCSSLNSIKIPEGVTSIGRSAFEGCSSLNSINIPEGVTCIGEEAFKGCSYLEIVIDNSKKKVEVGWDAFKNCKSVKWLKD